MYGSIPALLATPHWPPRAVILRSSLCVPSVATAGLSLLRSFSRVAAGALHPRRLSSLSVRSRRQPVRDANGNILTTPVTLADGTEFTAQTMDFLSSEKAVEGDPIILEAENNVIVNGAIAIAAGSRVKGVIASVTHAGRLGKAGSISIRVESGQTVDGQTVRLRATKTQNTGDKVGSVVALTVLVSPLFLLKKGNDVAYQPGTRVPVLPTGKWMSAAGGSNQELRQELRTKAPTNFLVGAFDIGTLIVSRPGRLPHGMLVEMKYAECFSGRASHVPMPIDT